MVIVIGILAIITVIFIILSFCIKKKSGILLCEIGYCLSFLCFYGVILYCVPKMSIEGVRYINHNVGYGSNVGIMTAVICSLFAKAIKRKTIAFKGLAIFGVIIFLAGNFLAMYTYVDISERDIPIVTSKENVIIYTDTEYEINDLIEVENSHGEKIIGIVWAEGSYDDTTDIIISEDGQSFYVTENYGELQICILIYNSKLSDSEAYVVRIGVTDK